MPKAKINFVPARGKYLIRVQEAESMKNGVYIPDNAKDKPMEGVVLAIGGVKKTNRKEVDYFLKDVILFEKYAGKEVTVDDENYLIIDEGEILGKRI
jgi:chaperonin GroES